MSVDTVNTIVDITTLAEVQNQLTILADATPTDMKAQTAVPCTGGDAGDMATKCTGDNITCSAKCTAVLDAPPTDPV